INEFEVDELAFVQGLIALALDAGMVDEDVLTGFLGYKAKPLLVIEPLDLATRHNSPSVFKPLGKGSRPTSAHGTYSHGTTQQVLPTPTQLTFATLRKSFGKVKRKLSAGRHG